MGVLSWFKTTKLVKTFKSWAEFGRYNATFVPFGDNLYASDLVRSCIRPLAEHTSKANPICTDKRIERILKVNPNMYMNGAEFLQKLRIKYELKNTAFIYIERDKIGKVVSFYPVPYRSYEAVEYNNGLYLEFSFPNSSVGKLILPWDDLVPIRKDYNESDISGDDNRAILDKLNLISTTNQGVANAIKSTANLRGILKNTKGILADEDKAKQKELFIKEYMNLENEGGIASIDSTQEFIPVTMSPTITSWQQTREFREDVYRYFGVNDAIVMSNYTEQQFEAFYESKIEPFLNDLSLELTRKVFTERELGFGNQIIYEANKLQFASMSTKISIFKEVVLYGGMTINEWRSGCNLAPLDGGDVPIRRLDADVVDNQQDNVADESEEDTEVIDND